MSDYVLEKSCSLSSGPFMSVSCLSYLIFPKAKLLVVTNLPQMHHQIL